MKAFYAIAAPGLEPLVADEIRALPGAHAVQVGPGGVTVQGDDALLYRMNLELRCASRVLLRLGTFRARDFAALCRGLHQLPLGQIIDRPRRITVRATAHRSRLYHTGAIIERVLSTLGDRGLHTEDVAAEPGPAVYLRTEDDLFTVSVDSSGELLHQRGWRTEGGEAPLRETLAAALLRLAGYAAAADERLADPTCGSGTLAIEGALLARRRAPGIGRDFAFFRWPSYRPEVFAALCREARARERRVPSELILASDLSADAIAVARRNAERAEVADCIRFVCRDVVGSRLPEGATGGLVLCNPPYGKRVGPGQGFGSAPSRLRALYRAIGQYARSAPGWRLGLICSAHQLDLARAAERNISTTALDNGGLRVLFCCSAPLPLPAGRDYDLSSEEPAAREHS